MPGAVAVDVVDRRVDRIDHGHRNLGAEIFRREIGLAGHARHRHEPAGGGVAHDLDLVRIEGGRDVGKKPFGHVAVHEQRFGRVADAHPLALRIDRDRLRHGQVCRPIDVDVAVAREVLEHRHPCLGTDATDQRLPSAGNHDVDEVVHLEKRADRLAVGGIDQLHAVDRQAGGCDRPPHALHDPAA